jgi:hypothetical protein
MCNGGTKLLRLRSANRESFIDSKRELSVKYAKYLIRKEKCKCYGFHNRAEMRPTSVTLVNNYSHHARKTRAVTWREVLKPSTR